MPHPAIAFVHVDDDGQVAEASLPARYEVCPRCEGRGKHVNPSVDGNGITGSEMEELGPDFRHDYLSGVYDVNCYECNGLRVVLVPDEDRADPAVLEAYWREMEDERAHGQMLALEREMGC